MSVITIRRASNTDLETLQALMFALHDEHHQAEPEHFKKAEHVLQEKQVAEYIEAPDALIYVAQSEGNVVGFITAHFGELNSSVSKPVMMGSIDELYVLPHHRSQGIGRRLIERCFTELGDYGVKQMFVEVWHFNQKALDLYQNLGFQHHIHWLRKALI